MSSPLVLSYAFNTSDLGVDSSGSGLNLTNTNVVSVNDSERGSVASFNGSTAKLILPSSDVPSALTGNSARTISCWVKHSTSSDRLVLFRAGNNSSGQRLRITMTSENKLWPDVSGGLNSIGTTPLVSGTWHHVSLTYDGTIIQVYLDGILDVTWSTTVNTAVNDLIIGEDETSAGIPFVGMMSDFRVYDYALSETEVTADMNDTYEAPGESETVKSNEMVAESGVFFMDLVWSADNLARSYKIEYTGADDSEGILVTSETSASVGSLTPNTEYVFTLFSTNGSSFVEYGSSVTASTLENLEANYDITDFQDSTGVTDLSSLDESELAAIDEHMNELLESGDVVSQNILSGSVDTTFVKRGETIDTSGSEGVGSYTVPFIASAGSGQEVTISTGTEVIAVSYDETTGQVVVGGTSYSNGDSLVVDGKRMIVYNT